MAKGKRQTIWIDGNRTQTADDLDNLGACQAFIDRIWIDIEYILDQIPASANPPNDVKELLATTQLSHDIPHKFRQGLFFKRLGLLSLYRRRDELSRRAS